MKSSVLFLAVIISSLPLVCAQETPGEDMQESPAAAETTQPRDPSAAYKEGLRLAGFPTRMLKYEPALLAAFQLTDNQVEQLQAAYNETVKQSKADLPSDADDKLVRHTTRLAGKDFIARRDGILSGEQLSLITAINDAYRFAREQPKEGGKDKTKERFLEKIKTLLSEEQQARVKAAGGKLP